MAHELPPNQRCTVVLPPPPPPPPPLPDFRSLIPPPPAPAGYFTVVNPIYRPPHGKMLITPDRRLFFPAPAPAPFVVNPAYLIRMDEERTKSLIQFMSNEGLVPSAEDEEKRKHAIQKLKQVVLAWIKKVAWQRGFPKSDIDDISATVLTYGSYGLGAHGPESDIDALCAGPYFATMAEDFFIVLHNMLQSMPEVSDIHCVKDAKVPLMRFKFNGISMDLPYARLRVRSVSDNIDIFSPLLLWDIDETSRKSLSGVRANMYILQLVPNVEKFQSVLRCLKLWAKRRGVYCNLVGFFGGIHIMVLTAFVCQRHPNASISALISIFFETFASWPWPRPVMLADGLPALNGDGSLMPIQLPCSPNELCHSNITRSTFHKIVTEFLRGRAMTRDRPGFQWSSLFDPFPYTKKYRHFVRIFLAASNQDELGDWVGWVKSRFRSLLLKLEDVLGLCDPSPTEYINMDGAEPNIVFYWGLMQPSSSDFTEIELVEKYFMNHINNGFQGRHGKLELAIVESSHLPKEAQMDTCSANVTSKAYWRILNYNQQRKPVYSQFFPNYFVGYEA